MNRRFLIRLATLSLGAFALWGTGCRRASEEAPRSLGYDAFAPVYNRYIADWIKNQQQETANEITRIEAELAAAPEEAKERLRNQLTALRTTEEKWRFRTSLGDFLKTGKPSDVPSDLVWKDGMDQPEIGDPAAKKGGVFRRNIETFPPTIRSFGDNSNNSFRGDLYDYIDVPLVALHPETMAIIPGLAKEWAVSSDGRTIYFRIDPEARYSDGKPVRSKDFLIGVYIRVSDNVVNPYQKQYYRENVAQIAVYDDLTLSVSLPEVNLFAAANAGAIQPAPPHFYAEYGPDFSQRYQWRFPPTTGAYEVRPEDIVKGASITQTRVKNWWAKDRKYYRYRFNPDKIVSTVVRDESKAFELFRAGELDTYLLTRPELWYEKSQIDPVYKGYIERVTFYNRYPKVPRGLYLNVSKPPLDDINVRIGIQHAMNWQKVIDVMYRGDYQRLNFFYEGFGDFSDTSIKARPYSIDLARQSFRAAGYTQEDREGYLTKPDGTRLSASVTYPAMPISDRMLAILREDAKACGFDLRLDGLEFTVAYKKEMQKQHEMALSSWLVSPPLPDYYQFLHSTNARDEKGNLKPQTNNIFVWGRPDTDALSEKVRTGATVAEVRDASWKLQRIMHDEAIFAPGFSVDFVRVGSWRWVRWPDCENTRFCPPVVYDPHEVFVFWIDEDMQAETQAARRTGKSFPESTKTVDAYRITSDPASKPEPAAPADELESPMNDSGENILEVDKLITSFETDRGLLRAVDQVSFTVPEGKTVGIVGESGCGKSVTAMSIVRLLPQPAGKILGGHVYFRGRDLLRAGDSEMRKIRGGDIGVIFQEPMSALNPVHRIGKQVSEVIRLHKRISKRDAWDAATEMLKLVRIPAPEKRMMDYPHHLSGGMRQRIVIALALACKPSLVIADEPTTALDVTVQAQILDLMAKLQSEMKMSIILITHDLGVIAETCDEVVVMYAGRVVESASAEELFANPLHAYTKGLLSSIPTLETRSKSILNTIPGMVASLADHTHGCRFCQRMGRSSRGTRERPGFAEVSPRHWVETCPECYQPG